MILGYLSKDIIDRIDNLYYLLCIKQKLSFLKQLAYLSPLSPAQLLTLLHQLDTLPIQPGEILYDVGCPSDYVYIL